MTSNNSKYIKQLIIISYLPPQM